MTDGPGWGPLFDQVNRLQTTASPKKLSWQNLTEQFGFIKKRYAADLTVAMGAVDTGDDFDPFGWLHDWSHNLDATLTEHTEAIAQLSDIAVAMGTTQAYVGDLQDMPTVPRSQLVCWGGSAAPSRDVLNTTLLVGGALVKVNCLPVFYPSVTTGPSKGHIYYTPIIVDRVGDVGSIRWIVGADTSVFSIDYYEVAFCGYDPPTGNIVKIWGSGDITSAEADVASLTEIDIDMALSSTRTTPGQILFFAHQQIAPGLLQSPRAFAAVPQGGVARPSSMLLDGACFVAPDYTQGIPSSISLASLTRENRMIPWGAVTVNL